MLIYNKREKKEMKEHRIEYVFKHVSPTILWHHVSTINGLAKWYCDNCDRTDDVFTFAWAESEEQAKVVSCTDGKQIRFHFEGDDESAFFEFAIEVNPLTKDVTLVVRENTDETEEDTQRFWDCQIEKLRKSAGL